MSNIKHCPKCNADKSRDEFYQNAARWDGLDTLCTACSKIQNAQRRRNRIARDPMAHRQQRYDQNVRNKYGLDPAERQAMAEAQGGLCAICGQPETRSYRGKVKQLSVDHNHDTGVVRELLCGRCNLLVGQSDEDVELLSKVSEYLRRHGAV